MDFALIWSSYYSIKKNALNLHPALASVLFKAPPYNIKGAMSSEQKNKMKNNLPNMIIGACKRANL